MSWPPSLHTRRDLLLSRERSMSASSASPTPSFKTPPPLTPAILGSQSAHTSNDHHSEASTPTASSTNDIVFEETRSTTSETNSLASSVSVLERVLALKNLPLHAPHNISSTKPDPGMFRTAPARTVGSISGEKLSMSAIRSMLAKRAAGGPGGAVGGSGGDMKSPSKQFGTLRQVSTQVVVPDDFQVKYADDDKGDVSEEVLTKWRQHRKLVATEILETEKSYVSAMRRLVELYVEPTQQSGSTGIPEQISKDIFKSIPNILSLNSAFLSSLECAIAGWDSTERIADRFLEYFQLFRTYKDFAAMHELKTTPALEKLARTKAFQSYQDKVVSAGGDMLASYLIMPIQRLPRYKLLLESLIKLTPRAHAEAPRLREALYKIGNVAQSVNEAMRDAQQGMQLMKLQTLFGRADIVAAGRKLLIEAPVVVVRHAMGTVRVSSDEKGKKDSKAKKDKDKWSGQKGMLYVFSDMVLLGVKVKDREREYDKQSANGNPYQLYAEHLQHSCAVAQLAVHDLPSLKQDHHEVTLLSPVRALTLAFSTDAMKAAVLRALREAEGVYRELTDRRGQQEVHAPAASLAGCLVPGCDNCVTPFYDLCAEQQFRPATYQFVCTVCLSIVCTQCAVVHHAQTEAARGAESPSSFGLGAGCSGMMSVECSKCSPPGKANKKQPVVAPATMFRPTGCVAIPLDTLKSVKLRSVAPSTHTPNKYAYVTGATHTAPPHAAHHMHPSHSLSPPSLSTHSLNTVFADPPTPVATRSNSAPRLSTSLPSSASSSLSIAATPIDLDASPLSSASLADARPVIFTLPPLVEHSSLTKAERDSLAHAEACEFASSAAARLSSSARPSSSAAPAAVSLLNTSDEAGTPSLAAATPRKMPPPLPSFLAPPLPSPSGSVPPPLPSPSGSLPPPLPSAAQSLPLPLQPLTPAHPQTFSSVPPPPPRASLSTSSTASSEDVSALDAYLLSARRSVAPPPLPANIVALARATSASTSSCAPTPSLLPVTPCATQHSHTHADVDADAIHSAAAPAGELDPDAHAISDPLDQPLASPSPSPEDSLMFLPPPPSSTPPLHARKSVFDRNNSPLVPLPVLAGSPLVEEDSDDEVRDHTPASVTPEVAAIAISITTSNTPVPPPASPIPPPPADTPLPSPAARTHSTTARPAGAGGKVPPPPPPPPKAS